MRFFFSSFKCLLTDQVFRISLKCNKNAIFIIQILRLVVLFAMRLSRWFLCSDLNCCREWVCIVCCVHSLWGQLFQIWCCVQIASWHDLLFISYYILQYMSPFLDWSIPLPICDTRWTHFDCFFIIFHFVSILC